jgi:hypothetical protein
MSQIPAFIGDSLKVSSRPVADSVGVWVEPSPSAEGVFGAGSRLVEAAGADVGAPAVDIMYSVALLACLAGWILIVYIYRDYILPALGIVRGSVATEKLLDKRNKLFSAYLNWAVVLGVATVGLACSKDIVVAGVCAAAAGTVWGTQWLLLAAAGRLTLYKGFTARLFYLRKIVAAATGMALVPLFLLYALSGGVALGWSLVAMGSLAAVFVFVRTLMLFVRQRFSILVWFLYLCAVEILPVVTVVVAAGKLCLLKL